jgi:hypothetical protein
MTKGYKMHVAQIILVKAEDAEEARDLVEGHLSEGPSWSDWNHSGGPGSFAGRWEGEFFGEDNELDVLCYADNPELAEQVIAKKIALRMSEIADIRESISGISLASIDYDPEKRTHNLMDIWRHEQLAKLLIDEWCPESHIYDLEEQNAHLGGFRKRVDADPQHEFLVVVDFHF